MGSGLIQIFAAEEPSKVPFYVAGGLLAGWAVVLSALGLTQPTFPGSPGRARAVMALSAVLVLLTVTSAVATSSKPEGEGEKAHETNENEKPGGADQQQGGVAPTSGAAQQAEDTGGGTAAAGASADAGTIAVAADPGGELAFVQKQLSGDAGKVTIELTNEAPVPHDVTIEQGGRKLAASKVISESRASVAVDLRPGEYVFYCSVAGHRESGMEGKLSVQ